MKYPNIVIYSIIPLALLSILSLQGDVQAQTNTIDQIAPQKNQAMNSTIQALMKVNIDELKDNLMNAKLAIVNGNIEEAITGVRDVETQLLLIKPSPTKFLNDLHKITNAIAKGETQKSLDSLTKVQVDILKAENQIFKAALANPQLMQQINNNEQITDDKDSTDEEDPTDEEDN